MAKKDDPTTDPSLAEDTTAAPEPATEVAEAPATPEVPAEAETPSEEATGLAEEAPKAGLKANSDGVDLAASAVPEVPTVNTQPIADPNATPLTAAETAQKAADPTPEAEAALQVPLSPVHIDGSGVLQQTNQQVIDQLPRNENGQVVIDSEGRIVGLDQDQQPSQPSGSAG